MPKKGTKKVRSHIRQRTMFKVGNVEVKDPLNITYVKTHFRKKSRKRRR